MKKILLMCSVLFLAASAADAADMAALETAINDKAAQQQLTYPSSFSKDNGVLPLSIKTAYVEEVPDADMTGKTAYFNRSKSITCAAVKIYENWLAVSAACVHNAGNDFSTFKLDGHKISAEQIIGLNNHDIRLMLVFVPREDKSGLTKTLKEMPVANLLVLSKTATAQDVAELKESFYINRQRLTGLGRTTAEVKPDLKCTQTGCDLTLEYKLIKADLGDPLFSVDQKGQEFLVGFNAYGGLNFQLFNEADLRFIQQSVTKRADAASWRAINQKIVDETYFAQN